MLWIHLWSSLYFAASCGEAHLLIIMISIENQELPGYLKLRGLYLRPEGRSFTPQLGNRIKSDIDARSQRGPTGV